MRDVQRLTAPDGTTLGIVGRHVQVEGIRFVTEDADPLQVGVMERPKGHRVAPHRHPDRPITVGSVSEFLFVERGRLRCSFHDDAGGVLASVELGPGDFLLILSGVHSVEFLEDSRVTEVKQGPYPGESAAKEYLTSG